MKVDTCFQSMLPLYMGKIVNCYVSTQLNQYKKHYHMVIFRGTTLLEALKSSPHMLNYWCSGVGSTTKILFIRDPWRRKANLYLLQPPLHVLCKYERSIIKNRIKQKKIEKKKS